MEYIDSLTERVTRGILNLCLEPNVKNITDKHIKDMELAVEVLKAKIKGNYHNG